MFILCYFVILISLCEISYVSCLGDIHIKVTDQNNTYQLYDKYADLEYNDGEFVQLRCIISTQAFGVGKSCKLTWMDDNGKVYLSGSEQFLNINITLTSAEDGLKLHCNAVTEQKTMSLYVGFSRYKTESVIKPTIFWILILSISGFVGGSFIILITWSLISRLCKKKVKECDTQVIFSEDFGNTNNKTLESSNTYLSEIGFSNQSEDLQTDDMEKDVEWREDIDSDRKNDFKQNSLYITAEECKRHGSSTEC